MNSDRERDGRDSATGHDVPASPAGHDLRPGQQLDGRFVVIGIVSRSGMAIIYRATDLLTAHDVALKVPHLHYEHDPRFYACFLREEQIGLSLAHPYLLKFIPVANRSRPYIVTEFLHGETLAQLLKRAAQLPEPDALGLASRICEALTHMHERGIIHRDLKPQNVMLCRDGSIRVMDFGIARITGKRLDSFGSTLAKGTPEYMAPEHVYGKREDGRSDIYSLGTMLYEMVTGVIPFAGTDEDRFAAMNAKVTGDPVAPRTLNRSLSEQAEEIILHAMERDPRKRYPTTAAMKAELDQPGTVPLTGRCRRLQAPAPWKRHAVHAVVIGFVLASIVFGLVRLVMMVMRRGP